MSSHLLARLTENICRDIAFAARTLRRTPGFTAVAVLILAIGIGVNTTIFRFVSALLLQPPRVADAGHLLQIWNVNPKAPSVVERYVPLSYPDYAYYRDHNHSFDGMLAFEGDPNTVSWMHAGQGEIAQAQYVSGNFFRLLGVNAVLGSATLPADDGSTNGTPTVVISDRFWRARLNADRSVIGSTIDINGVTFTVAGVAPPSFTGLLAGFGPDVWIPFSSAEAVRHNRGLLSSKSSYWLFAVGRLRNGVTAERATSDVQLLARQVAIEERGRPSASPDESRSAFDIALFPETLVPGPFRLPVSAFIGLLQIVVLMVLLIACANAANLFLAQAASRRPEITLRWVLGASRGRLVQLVLAQTLLVSLLAGAVGYLFAQQAAPQLLRLAPATLPIRFELSVDWHVIAFGVALALGVGLVFGLLPALQTTSAAALGAGRGSTGGRERSRLRTALVVTQVSVSLVLLVAGALCWQSLMRAQSVDPGFRVANHVAAAFDLNSLGYSDSAGSVLERRLVERVAALPGVRQASTTSYLPLSTTKLVTGLKVPGVTGDEVSIQTFDVGPGYFTTMGTRLLQGREFGTGDDDKVPRVCVVNDATARKFWPNGNAVGQIVAIGLQPGKSAACEVIGVVATGKYRSLSEPPTPILFRAERQSYHGRLTVVADIDRASQAIVIGGIRQAARALDPKLVVITGTLEDHLGFAIFPARATGIALGVAGIIGLLLALAGLAAVMAQSVAQRTREIGIRMALGADRQAIVGGFVREGARLLGVGIAIGAVIAFAATRLLSGILYGISASDPLTFVGVTALLAASALGACLLVAMRATAVDPMAAMRSE
jgi:putative ABC transport system permease protein